MMEEQGELQGQSTLIEQYKIIVEMADRTSARRGIANNFYITLLSALLAFVAFFGDQTSHLIWQGTVYLVLGVVGILICGTWLITVTAYKRLNKGRFEVIHEIEERLPYPVFKREWEILKGVKNANATKKKKYKELTNIESYVPIIMAVPYAGLIVYSIIRLLS